MLIGIEIKAFKTTARDSEEAWNRTGPLCYSGLKMRRGGHKTCCQARRHASKGSFGKQVKLSAMLGFVGSQN